LKESALESKLCREIRKIGGRALKLTTPNHIPDRLVLLPGGGSVFVEMKAPGEKPRKGQLAMHDYLRRMGHEVLVIDNDNYLTETIRKWQKLSISHRSMITSGSQ